VPPSAEDIDLRILQGCKDRHVTLRDARALDYYLFRDACADGHLHAAKYLASLGLTIEEIRGDCNVALQLACARGHLAVAEWLVGLGLTPSDLHEAAMYEHPCVARWPLQAGPPWDSRGIAPRKVIYPAEVVEWFDALRAAGRAAWDKRAARDTEEPSPADPSGQPLMADGRRPTPSALWAALTDRSS
jgi:hypothetical protein